MSVNSVSSEFGVLGWMVVQCCWKLLFLLLVVFGAAVAVLNCAFFIILFKDVEFCSCGK